MAITTPVYCTREDVKGALDSKESARNNAQIDRAIEASARGIDGHTPGGGFLHRRFYPEIVTRYFDWPNGQYARSWRLWLDANELISATALVIGGVTIAAADYNLEPNWGPPYTRIEIDLSSTAAFAVGSTYQRDIALTGVYGHSADEATAGTLAAAITTTTATTCNVSDSSLIGVGQIIKVDSERMIVAGKTMLTTGQTLQTPLTASVADVTVAVTTGSAYAVDEVILLDSERMLIVDIAGNNLTVKRAWDGTVLAAHTGSTIYAPRTLTITRGALGTTAATHLNAAAVVKHVVPPLVRELNVAESINSLLQESSGYARTFGSGESERLVGGRGLADIRDQAYTAYGRKMRMGAV